MGDQDEQADPTPSFEELVLTYMDESDRLRVTVDRGGTPIDVIERMTEAVGRARLAARQRAAARPEDVPSLASLRAAAIQGMRIVLDGTDPKDILDGQEFMRLAHVIRDLAHPQQTLKTLQSNRLMTILKARKAHRLLGVLHHGN